MTQSIYRISLNELEDFLSINKEPEFRKIQILDWLLNKNISKFYEISNISLNLRRKLSDNFFINKPFIDKKEVAEDNTIKYLINLNSSNKDDIKNQEYIETVGIPNFNLNSKQFTLCISTQVGCPIACAFCATGKQGFKRNLNYLEILYQIKLVEKDLNTRISNIVVMGQGEPFLNYDNLLNALYYLNNNKFFNIGARKITISTSGIIPSIYKFSQTNKQYGLAISLHSANQKIRDRIMPGVKNYNLNKLKTCLLKYQDSTNRRITFEYLLIENINDKIEDLDLLIEYCHGLNCHINLLHLNHVDNSIFIPSKDSVFRQWESILNKNNINTTTRNSRGEDINAACGQLLISQIK